MDSVNWREAFKHRKMVGKPAVERLLKVFARSGLDAKTFSKYVFPLSRYSSSRYDSNYSVLSCPELAWAYTRERFDFSYLLAGAVDDATDEVGVSKFIDEVETVVSTKLSLTDYVSFARVIRTHGMDTFLSLVSLFRKHKISACELRGLFDVIDNIPSGMNTVSRVEFLLEKMSPYNYMDLQKAVQMCWDHL